MNLYCSDTNINFFLFVTIFVVVFKDYNRLDINLMSSYLTIRKRLGGCKAASGIDSVEGLSWGSREGEALPFLEAWMLLSHSSRSFLRLFRLLDFVPS
jgi:hypothetical protein